MFKIIESNHLIMQELNQNNRPGFIKRSFTILKNTDQGFLNEDSLKYSASLAYYTVFSIGPILVLMITLASLFYGEDAVKGRLFGELNSLVGASAASQIQSSIKNLELSGECTFALVVGGVSLFRGATSVVGDIQDSINLIWLVCAKPKKVWLKIVMDRVLSCSLVIGLGFLLVVTRVIHG